MKETVIELPLSKSIAIRKMIVFFVKYGKLMPLSGEVCSDIQTVQTILKRLKNEETGRAPSLQTPTILDARDCGAAFRFCTALAAGTPGEWILTGTEQLLRRPILPLIDALNANGADIHVANDGLHIHGKKLNMNRLEIDCRLSSQFGSALLLAAPLMGNPTIEIVPDNLSSRGYLAMTQKIMSEPFQEDKPIFIERDWSAALYWYAFALLHPACKLLLKGLTGNSLQPDARIAEWFEKWGIHTEFTSEGALLNHLNIQMQSEQRLDLSQNIDAAPVLAVTALLYPFELTLEGLDNLNQKESPRRDILVATLSQFTEIQNITDSSFTICRRSKPLPQHISLSSHNDHRFVMAWSLLKPFTKIEIDNELCVRKSYPGFQPIPDELD